MKQHRYRVTVEHLELPDGTLPPEPSSLSFDVANHEDLLAIVERARRRGDLPARHAVPFAIGLKLFSEVMLQHRDLPLFEPLVEPFKAFMQHLKQQPVAAPVRQQESA